MLSSLRRRRRMKALPRGRDFARDVVEGLVVEDFLGEPMRDRSHRALPRSGDGDTLRLGLARDGGDSVARREEDADTRRTRDLPRLGLLVGGDRVLTLRPR